jgi:hypothetical protein
VNPARSMLPRARERQEQMSTRYTPEPAPIDYHSDHEWRRQQAALQALEPGDILARVDAAIASEADPEKHPLFSAVCSLLGCGNQRGTPDGLWDTYRALIQQCIEAAVAEILADPHAWED